MQHGEVEIYACRHLKVHEKKYPTHDNELEFMVFSLKILRNYMYGVHVDVYADHKRLQYVFTQKIVEPLAKKLVIILEILQQECSLPHRKGNVVVDALSRTTMSIVSYVGQERPNKKKS